MFRKSKDLRRDLEGQLQEVTHRVRELAAGADRARFNRRPSEEAWSAAECVAHLNQTARLYLPELAGAIDDARSRGLIGERADGRTLLGRVVVWGTEPPPRLKMKTFDALEPASDHDPANLAEAFASAHGALLAQMNGAADLDRKRVRVRSLLDPRLKLSLDDWYAFLAAHARRHVWQAERALEETRS